MNQMAVADKIGEQDRNVALQHQAQGAASIDGQMLGHSLRLGCTRLEAKSILGLKLCQTYNCVLQVLLYDLFACPGMLKLLNALRPASTCFDWQEQNKACVRACLHAHIQPRLQHAHLVVNHLHLRAHGWAHRHMHLLECACVRV